MEAVRLPSSAVDPLISRLFRQALAPVSSTSDSGRPVAGLVSFHGDEPQMGWEELLGVAAELVRLGLEATGQRLPAAEESGVAAVLARTLWVVRELDTTDAQALRLGPQDYARRMRSAVPGADRELSSEAAWFHDSLLVTICLHFLHHLIVRFPDLAERLPELSHRIGQLVDLNDVEALRGRPQPPAQDAEFEERYLRHVAEQYNRVTIYGIDLPNPNTPDNWSLDATYLSLAAEFSTGQAGQGGQDARGRPSPRPSSPRTPRTPRTTAHPPSP